jgi:hypothetical protein
MIAHFTANCDFKVSTDMLISKATATCGILTNRNNALYALTAKNSFLVVIYYN